MGSEAFHPKDKAAPGFEPDAARSSVKLKTAPYID
jgi:hypothetical protein